MLRLRHDPLNQLLQQANYHRLPHALHDAVYGPFFKEARTSVFQPTIYASTLVKLAKAHLYINNFKEANIYIKDAEAFNDALGAKYQSNMRSEFVVTKGMCSYMDGEYNTALQLLEGIHQNKDGMRAKILKENEMMKVMVLLVRALISDAATNPAANKKSMRTKVNNLLDNALSLNFDTRVAMELINFSMISSFYPEVEKILLKMKDYITEHDDYVIEPIEEDPESRVYYGEAYTVPVVEKPIYVVHHWQAEDDDDDLDKDTITVPKASQGGFSGATHKNEVDVCISDEIESREPALEAKRNYNHA